MSFRLKNFIDKGFYRYYNFMCACRKMSLHDSKRGGFSVFEINLESLFASEGMRVEIDHTLDLSGIDFSGENPLSDSCKIKGVIENRTGIVSMNATVTVYYSGTCDRCAAKLDKKYTIPMEHTFVTELNDETNDEFILVPTMRFDLEGLATEDVLLYLPSKFLCSEDCKGICSRCGKNLNEGPCDCKPEVDPRLASLLTLLSDED